MRALEEGAMRRVGLSLALCAIAVGQIASGDVATSPPGQSAQIQIRDVEVRLSDHGPVVLLKAEQRAIPIFVDPTVAGSIHSALTGQKLRRPLSHDLMHTILDSFGGRVTQVIVTLKDGVYYGALSVEVKDTTKVFDSRSSDAIALAVHFKAPILVGRDLLESAGKLLPDSKGMTL
jgi:hypothetical protein